MSPAQRTDHMSTDELRQRASEQIAMGFKAMGEAIFINVKFNGNFDDFASNTAYELRHLITYRSDGGHFARGLVRQSGDLEKIHKSLKGQTLADGQRVRLAAFLFRRVHLDPNMRWMLSMRFGLVKIDMDSEVIVASPAIVQQSRNKLAQDILDRATVYVTSRKDDSDATKRMRAWVSLATRIGSPAYLELWYYNRVAAFEFVNWNTLEPRRLAMTRATNGRLPFDGATGSMSQSGTFSAPPDTPWRNYPFKDVYKEAMRHPDPQSINDYIAAQLNFSEDEILRTISEIVQQIKRVSMASGLDFSSNSSTPSDALGALASAFAKDVGKRLKDPNTLYGIYSTTHPGVLSWADRW